MMVERVSGGNGRTGTGYRRLVTLLRPGAPTGPIWHGAWHVSAAPAGRAILGGMTYPSSPQVISGDRTLLIALVRLPTGDAAEQLGFVEPGPPFWVRSRQAAQIVASGTAAYAGAGTPLPPAEPPWTVRGMAGFARGTTNAFPLSGGRNLPLVRY
jgi:hypothetical protein